MAVALAVVVLAFLAAPRASPVLAGELEDYGEYLSSQCTTCHRTEAPEGGIPPIGHLPKDAFIAAMAEYQTGQRQNPAMVNVAISLTAEEIEALAAYYDAQRQQPPEN